MMHTQWWCMHTRRGSAAKQARGAVQATRRTRRALRQCTHTRPSAMAARGCFSVSAGSVASGWVNQKVAMDIGMSCQCGSMSQVPACHVVWSRSVARR